MLIQRALLAGLAAVCGLAACSTATPAPEAQAVTVAFTLTANGKPARCGAPLGPLGAGGIPAVLHDARFYVQDVALIDTAGTAVPLTLAPNEWQTAAVALLDFEDGSGGCAGGTRATNAMVTGTVPAGRYAGLAFTVGVPPALNHSSTEKAPAPLDIAAMGWSWQAGRKLMKVEIDPVGGLAKLDTSKARTWYLHLGSTGCTGNPANGESVSCTRPNRLPVTVAAFDPATQAVALDLSSLFEGSALERDRGGAVGCMSGPTDPECGPVFRRLGLSLDDGRPVTPGSSPAFTVVAKP
ncbi:putative repeat protein (TIGR04052 family) [Azospirillum agricola]|uniref:MbnP family copper-binding protein n=1 Tax=Azospirillum agricola TaxID=1720247 RepID=UPI001AE1DD3D|nr:MbnP family copper-binding protein [Azospirillum agricola]MBP2232610.1 putative repeat protein (TIGR04052 family) [Azospirillum agricola]